MTVKTPNGHILGLGTPTIVLESALQTVTVDERNGKLIVSITDKALGD